MSTDTTPPLILGTAWDDVTNNERVQLLTGLVAEGLAPSMHDTLGELVATIALVTAVALAHPERRLQRLARVLCETSRHTSIEAATSPIDEERHTCQYHRNRAREVLRALEAPPPA